ncbi:MAG: hypothetical protein ACYTFY_12840, partial [Planctomycetota bacterium]|jgi:hypothetical protein
VNSVLSSLGSADSKSQDIASKSVMDFQSQLMALKENPESAGTFPVFDTFQSILNMGSSKSGTKSIPEISADLAENISWLENSFGSFFDMMNINPADSVSFQLDGVGGVSVKTDSKDMPKIEQMFQNNPVMVSRYAVAAARASLINAYETDPGFKAGFDYDPRQAIKDNIGLLKDKLLGGSMTYQDRKLTPVFE